MQTNDSYANLDQLAILPGKNSAVLCQVLNDSFKVVADLDFGYHQKHAIGGNSWIVAVCNRKKPSTFSVKDIVGFSLTRPYLFRARILESGQIMRLPDIPLPRLALSSSIALKDDAIYLAGRHFENQLYSEGSQGEIAFYLNLLEQQPDWKPLTIPIELIPGKSIDDVLVIGNKLVLVDNLIYPKYLFEYDVTNPLNPVSTQTVTLPNNGTYEHIYRGCAAQNWVVLYSGGVGMTGTGYYISVLRLPKFEQLLTIRLLHRPDEEYSYDNKLRPFDLGGELENVKNEIHIKDFALVGDTLLVACGHHGLKRYPLQEFWDAYSARQAMTESRERYRAEQGVFRRKKFLSLQEMIDKLEQQEKDGIRINPSERRKERRIKVLQKKERQTYAFHSIDLEDCEAGNWSMPEQLETVDKLVQLHDSRVVAISYGETGRALEYQILDC